ncbi:two component system sensor kinase [Shewanella sp. NKUCC05_KAH]|uniref:histidine kinase n=1 Tax=Shewanella oncorhynchi TaxID=2726434 RepID=A0ABX1KQY7_9GAMM|nr:MULTISPECIES: two component system sensor kinase [Shewanella]MBI1676101.1 two component system sensor kinase [Shewanella sp. DW31]MBP7662383.1 two component system sensor kinase [Shewanella sp.]MBW3528083.1 two component system sensor kinase [Shewanella sp. NKUCC05_KAH]NLQ24621.1 two component system sensor kinase [Shewanella oncorhynchi]
MKIQWKFSLVTKLTVSFMSVLVALWLMMEYLSYNNTFSHTLERSLVAFSELSGLRAEVSNTLFTDASYDVRQLDKQLKQFASIDKVNDQEIVSHYFPFQAKSHDDTLTMWVAQTFGSAGQHRYLDTFILKPNEGITIYAASDANDEYFQIRLREIKQLSVQASTTGYRWGTPLKDKNSEDYHLSFSYSSDPQDPLSPQVGFSINLASAMSLNNALGPGDISFFMTPKGELFSKSTLTLTPSILVKLKDEFSHDHPHAKNTAHPLGDYYVIKEHIHGPGWQHITLISDVYLKDMALIPFFKELPCALLVLVLTATILLNILKINLSKPMRNFVNIINNASQSTFEHRLPQDRNDELGQIAKAYNHLLDTVKESYDELEQKVTLRTNELALAKQEAEKANERKTEHLTTISHEIRTPLNGITGSLELLRNTQLTPKQMDLRDTAYNCANSLLAIINNLLDFSRIEADQIEMNLQSYPILKLADDAMITIQSRIVNKPITLKCLVNANVAEKALLDPLRVRQILVNLLGNSAKFTEAGQILLRIEVVKQHLYFSVEDTGGGVAIQDQQRIFEPFAQTCHHKSGTGLGLPISAKLASKMKGKLTMFSTLGEGSTFILDLPLVDPTAPLCLPNTVIVAPLALHPQLTLWGACPIEGDNPALASPELAHLPARLWQRLFEIRHNLPHKQRQHTPTLLPWRLKILLVDDVETNRDIIGKMLLELGQQVIAVSSGEAALEKGTRHIFDLVLMDIRMPGLDGYQTTQRWRNSEDILDGDCPIFALTANANPKEHDTIESAGMNSYITKPVSLKQLNHALEAAADMQLDRDMQLVINNEIDAPMIDFSHTDLNHRLAVHLADMAHQAKLHIENQAWKELSDVLHTIKGSAGLAGKKNIANEAADLEVALETKECLSLAEFSALDNLIHALDAES